MQITRKAEMKMVNENNQTPLLPAMLGLALCSGVIQLESAGTELSARRALRVILNSSNVANVFCHFFLVPTNGPMYLSCQFSTLYAVSYTLEPHESCQLTLSNQSKQSTRYVLVPERQTCFWWAQTLISWCQRAVCMCKCEA